MSTRKSRKKEYLNNKWIVREEKIRCPCGKMCFDKKGAQTRRNSLKRRGGEELRIYPCPLSNTWHLTHNVFSVENE